MPFKLSKTSYLLMRGFTITVSFYAGIGTITTKESIRLTKMAEDSGTHAFTVFTSYVY
jgi:dihydrodipicolinate synthase/N-acetylneuraminate lyase